MNQTRNGKLWVGLIAMGASIVGSPGIAAACLGVCGNGSTDWTAPGAQCQITVGSKSESWGYSELGQICNYDTNDTIRVVCPLQRQEWSSTSGLDCATASFVGMGGSVTGCGRNNANNWRCIVQSKDQTSIWGWWTGWADVADQGVSFNYSAETGSIFQDITFKLPHSQSVTTNLDDGGHYFMTCDLPPVGGCGGSNCLSSLKWSED